MMNIYNYHQCLNCNANSNHRKVGFRYYEIKRSTRVILPSLAYGSLVIVVDGEVKIDMAGSSGHNLSAVEMFSIPTHTHCLIDAITDTQLVVTHLNRARRPHSLLCKPFEYSSTPIEQIVYRFDKLIVHRPLKQFADSIINYMKDGIICSNFYYMKLREVKLLLPRLYKSDELRTLFSPILQHAVDSDESLLSTHSSLYV